MIQAFDSIDTVARLIQLSVAPVFLLAGVAGLLNVFTGRLTRIIDRLEDVDKHIEAVKTKNGAHPISNKIKNRRSFLIMRMQNINRTIQFCTLTGFFVALVIFTMFLTALFEFNGATFISVLFILAMLSLVSSLVLFLKEIFHTTSFINAKRK